MENVTAQATATILGGTISNLAIIVGANSVWLMFLGGGLSMVGVLYELIVEREGEEHARSYIFMTGLRGLFIGAITAPMVYTFLRDMGKELIGNYANINIETISDGFLFFFSLWVALYSSFVWDYLKELLLKKKEKINKKEE